MKSTKNNNKLMADFLKKGLAEADHMWHQDKSHPYIIGYLQGIIKSAILELDDTELRAAYPANVDGSNAFNAANN